jgi:hypothetical protein
MKSDLLLSFLLFIFLAPLLLGQRGDIIKVPDNISSTMKHHGVGHH